MVILLYLHLLGIMYIFISPINLIISTVKLFCVTFFICTFSFCQTKIDSSKTSNTIEHASVYIQKKSTAKNYSDLDLIKNSITSLPFIKGVHYSFNLNQLEKILPIQDFSNFLNAQNKSLLNRSFLKNTNTDLRFKSYVNMNGAAQIITLKGGFFTNYNGNYTLQISYRLSPNDYNINIPNLIKQEVQKGLALKLKINLENGTK